MKSSEQRAIRAQVLEQYPALEPFIDDIFPKKEPLIVCKWYASGTGAARAARLPSSTASPYERPCCAFRSTDYVQMVLDQENEFIFFQCRNGPFIPTIRFLHKCARACALSYPAQ